MSEVPLYCQGVGHYPNVNSPPDPGVFDLSETRRAYFFFFFITLKPRVE